MTITYKNNVYDFTGKRVKKNGKCMTKFDIAWEYDREIAYTYMVVCYEVIKYKELRKRFQEALIKKVGL